jgi:hypothetical protein
MCPCSTCSIYSTLPVQHFDNLIREKRIVQERNAAESSQRQSVPADLARMVSKRPSAHLTLARSANLIIQSFRYVNKQRRKFRINALSPAHLIEQPSEISAKGVAALGR